MAQQQPTIYERQALSLLRASVSNASPGLSEQLQATVFESGTGVLRLALTVEPVITLLSTPLHPDEVIDLPSSHDLSQVDSAISSAAESAARTIDLTRYLDARNAYPRLTSDVEVSSSLAAYVHHGRCAGCAGKKLVPCARCKAQGGFRCMTCDGIGETHCTHCTGTSSCQVCHGRRRVECRSCFGSKMSRCRHCKGKKRLKCEPCHASGVLRTMRSAALHARASYAASVVEGPSDLLARALELAGGARALKPTLGSPSITAITPSEAVYELRLPYCVIDVTLDGRSSRVSLVGTEPALVESGDFLEHALDADLRRLEAQVADSSSLFCDQPAMRSALRSFLSSRSHQLLVANPGQPQHGVSSGYGLRSVAAVYSALTIMRSNLLVSRAFVCAVAAALAYALVVSLTAVAPISLMPWFLAAAVAVWLSVQFSMSVTASALCNDPDVRRRLRDL